MNRLENGDCGKVVGTGVLYETTKLR